MDGWWKRDFSLVEQKLQISKRTWLESGQGSKLKTSVGIYAKIDIDIDVTYEIFIDNVYV